MVQNQSENMFDKGAEDIRQPYNAQFREIDCLERDFLDTTTLMHSQYLREERGLGKLFIMWSIIV